MNESKSACAICGKVVSLIGGKEIQVEKHPISGKPEAVLVCEECIHRHPEL